MLKVFIFRFFLKEKLTGLADFWAKNRKLKTGKLKDRKLTSDNR